MAAAIGWRLASERDLREQLRSLAAERLASRFGGAVTGTLGGAILSCSWTSSSVDAIITAVGMTDHLAIMYIAVVAITVNRLWLERQKNRGNDP